MTDKEIKRLREYVKWLDTDPYTLDCGCYYHIAEELGVILDELYTFA